MLPSLVRPERNVALEERPLSVSEAYDILERRQHVLLAEDDDEIRWALTSLFLNTGYQVRAVRDGAQLLNELASIIEGRQGKFAPDVIVTDVRMPGFSSVNIMTGLREAGWTTPVLFISAYGDPELKERVARLGFTEFFDKPLDLDALEASVSAAASGKRRRHPHKAGRGTKVQ